MRNQLYRTVARTLVTAAAIFVLVSPPAAAAGLPDSPDGTVKAVFASLADRHPEILWQALPASYQQDLTEVTHAFAEKIDPALWNSAFALGSKAAGVLRDKKEYFQGTPMMSAAGDEAARVEENWDTAVAAMDGFFSSDLSDLDNLKSMDWERFLSTTGVAVMDRVSELAKTQDADKQEMDFVTKVQKTKIDLVSRDGDNATVRVSAPDEDSEEVELTRVEGRWVPAEMAEEWQSNMADARKKIAEISEEEMAQSKAQAMMFFGMADAVLDQLAAANSQEEFDNVIQGIAGMFMGGGMGGG